MRTNIAFFPKCTVSNPFPYILLSSSRRSIPIYYIGSNACLRSSTVPIRLRQSVGQQEANRTSPSEAISQGKKRPDGTGADIVVDEGDFEHGTQSDTKDKSPLRSLIAIGHRGVASESKTV